MTTFSSHPVKPITTGEGGVLVTNQGAFAHAARTFRNHGISTDARVREAKGDWVYTMDSLGFNYRIPDILCALGTSQLVKLAGWHKRRETLAAMYSKAFSEAPALEPYVVRPDRQSAWHLYPLRLHLERLTVDRGQIYRALRAEGIGVNVHYIPVYWHPHYERLGYRRGMCPVAEQEYQRLVTLPLWPAMTDEDAHDVIEAVRKILTVYAVS
jgi:dTDP-4-amino-4,6-dideoxygalactose transaminase